MAPACIILNLGARYALPGHGGCAHPFAITVMNAVDQLYRRTGTRTATRLRGEPRAVCFTYRFAHKGAKF